MSNEIASAVGSLLKSAALAGQAGKRWRYYKVTARPDMTGPLDDVLPEQWPRIKGLPDGYTIKAYSPWEYFDQDAILFRIEHPSFEPLSAHPARTIWSGEFEPA